MREPDPDHPRFAVGYQNQSEHWPAIGLQGMSGRGLDVKFGNTFVVLLH